MVLPRPGPAPPSAPSPVPLAGPGSGAKERREALVSHLRDRGSTPVAELPELFGVSIETIRRDLRLLESTGRIRRSYGRVTAAESGSFESSHEFRVTHLTDEKERIAQAAVEHLGTAETVFLDEGFHPLLVGRALPAGRAIFVGSHTKFGHSTFARFGHVRQLERVITGRELRSSTARRLTGLGAVIERV